MNQEEFFSEFGHLALAPDGVARLRRLILDLAVRGRLVPQDPSDEPASVLLERIAKERERLVREKLMSKPTVQLAEARAAPVGALPGWTEVQFGVLSHLEYGKALPKSERVASGAIPVMGANGEMARCDEPLVRAPGLVVGRKGSAGAVNFAPEPFWPTDVAYFIRSVSDESLRFIEILLCTLDLPSLAKGIKPGLDRNEVHERIVGVPPLGEQERIVERVDELMAVCDELEQEQAKAEELRSQTSRSSMRRVVESGREETPEAIELLQQSLGLTLRPGDGAAEALAKTREAILDLAVRGRLVPQDPSDEPASVLLERIAEKRERLVAEKKIRKPKVLPRLDPASQSFESPEGWSWCYLGDLGSWGAGSTPTRGKKAYYGGGIPWVKSGELDEKEILSTEETVTELAVAETAVKVRPPGDLLVALYGVGTLGKTAIAGTELTTNQAVCACTPDRGVNVLFIQIGIRVLRSRLESIAAGGAQGNISRAKLIATPFCLPPTNEQERIVAKVDELMAVCDELEQTLQSERLIAAEFANSAVAALVA